MGARSNSGVSDSEQTAVFIAVILAMFVGLSIYPLLGGDWTGPRRLLLRSWGMTWRGIIAGIVALAFLLLAIAIGLLGGR